MSLPKTISSNGFFNRQKVESLLLPVLVVLILVSIITAGFLIPKKKEEKAGKRDTSAFTGSNKVEVEKGKVIEVAPKVKQISPETLYDSIISKKDIVIVQVFSGDEWQEPHIKGSVFINKSEFDYSPNLDQTKNYVFVSSDGYDSAEAISKLINLGFPYDKNVNLEGGLEAWKEKGYELE